MAKEIKIIQITLGVIDDTDGDVRQFFKALSEQAQDDALATARVAMNHGETTFANLRMLNAPAKILDFGGDVNRLGGQFR